MVRTGKTTATRRKRRRWEKKWGTPVGEGIPPGAWKVIFTILKFLIPIAAFFVGVIMLLEWFYACKSREENHPAKNPSLFVTDFFVP